MRREDPVMSRDRAHLRLLASAVAVAICCPAGAIAAPTESAYVVSAASPRDVATPEAVVEALYASITGPAGQARDWPRLRSLFRPDAKIGPVVAGRVRVGSVDDYIRLNGPFLMKDGFFERELSRRTERYGDIAHVFSTYASWTRRIDGAPIGRGINSIQMVNEAGRWQITSLVWSAETPRNPLPEAYLRD